MFAIPDAGTPLPMLIPLLVIYGAANSIQLTAMNTLALADLDNESASTGNSLLLVMQQLSMSLGVSVGAYLLTRYGAAP
jgi:predicted MFS family arabinose efflux permease